MAAIGMQEQGHSLERLARARFSKLTKSELNLVRAAPVEGAVAFCGPSGADDDPENDPSHADKWNAQRQIRAELIRWLCVDKRAKEQVDPQGLRIHGALIPDELYLSNVSVPFPLSFWLCALTKKAYFREIGVPSLDLRGCWVRELDAQGARVRDDIFLGGGFKAEGQVNLIQAHIGGDLDCSGGKFLNPPGQGSDDGAIVADGISVGGQLLLTRYLSGEPNNSHVRYFHAEGEVRLLLAQIGMNLDCSGGIFLNPPIEGCPTSGRALSADGIVVKGSVFLKKVLRAVGFYAEGEVRLLDAQVGGSLECEGGTFVNPEKKSTHGGVLERSGNALTVERAKIKGDVMLCKSDDGNLPVAFRHKIVTDSFTAYGSVSLAGSHTEGNLDFRRSVLKSTKLVLERATAGSVMYSNGNWPIQGGLFLDGFVYGRIADRQADADTMLKWLGIQPEESFKPQPYLQLAKVLRESGDDDGERRVLVAMEDRRWKADHPSAYALRLPLRLTAGYGYRPLWAFWEIAGLSALGWVIYRRSYLAGNIVPTEKEAYEYFKREGRPPAHTSAFSPLVYSVENSLPLVKLGQAEKWQPDPSSSLPMEQQTSVPGGANGLSPGVRLLRWFYRFLAGIPRVGTSSRLVRWFLLLQIVLGWLLATLFLAGVTGLIRKE